MDSNMVINSDYIQLCAGSDEERSSAPTGSSFKNNLILTNTNPTPFKIYDDVSGIEFAGNIINEGAEIPFENGFEKVPLELSKNAEGLTVPSQKLIDQIAFGEVKLPTRKEDVGAHYYPKDDGNSRFNSGKTIKVIAGENTLLDALNGSESGDILELESGGEYSMTKYAVISHPISIVTSQGNKARIFSEKQSFFIIENGGAIQMKNVTIDGSMSPDQAGNNVISTSKYSMNQNYAVVIEDCEVVGLDKNHSFDFLKSYKHTFADSIHIINTTMTNVTGAVMTMDMETEDLGIYNVENVKIINSTFKDVKHEIANVYRGGTDESTFGPIITISDVEIINSGKGKRNKIGSVLRFHGVQKLSVDNVKISDSEGVNLFMTNGEPITKLSNITFTNSSGLKTNGEPFESENIITNKK
jgi:poly(beta-D-mannuronate) lyase